MSEINVLYYSCPFDLSGYGAVSRNHLMNLRKIESLSIRLKTRRFWNGVAPDIGEIRPILQEMERAPIDDRNFIFIEHLTPENFFIDPRAKYHICYTPFETDGAPGSWLLGLRAMDEIWVPSQHNKESYIRAGIDANKIFVIPHGINYEKYNPTIDPMQYDRGAFNFGSVFDWTERKNPVALIRAYYNAFKDDEDVTLTIRTFWRFPIEKTKEFVSSEIEKIKSGFTDRKKFPRILLWVDNIEDELMPSFYRSLDCFVLPTRGEGFGLPFAEAMACGVPCVAPSWGGNREFMNHDNSYLIDGKVIPIDNAIFLRLQPQYSGQSWFDIDEASLSKTMRYIYDHQQEAKTRGIVASEYMKEKFTWENTAYKIYKRLCEIDGEKQI